MTSNRTNICSFNFFCGLLAGYFTLHCLFTDFLKNTDFPQCLKILKNILAWITETHWDILCVGTEIWIPMNFSNNKNFSQSWARAPLHFLCGEVESESSHLLWLLEAGRVSQQVRRTSHWQMLMWVSNLNCWELYLLIGGKKHSNWKSYLFVFLRMARKYYCSFMPYWRTPFSGGNFRSCIIKALRVRAARLFPSRE